MIVSAWYDGHGTYGVRVSEGEVSLWFRPEWSEVRLHLPDRRSVVEVPLTESFWHGSPELRSTHIRDFLLRHGLVDWPKNRPPRFELEPLGGGDFRLKWLEQVEGQRALPLEL
ncbi:MAG: hypothetical protein MUC56_10455 [Thermoanaerobaculales bacterium]|jgi:hypothetical protein|nr:hypothetical protein [Thermoanaerobaculales bacterium]